MAETEPAIDQVLGRVDNVPRSYRAFRILRIAGWSLIALQFVGFVIWSWYLLSRDAFGHDTAIYYQAWDLIAHGHLLPRNTIQGSYRFWQNDGEFIVYVFAPLYWIFPDHLIGLLWLQDLALSGTIAVCFGMVASRWLPRAVARDRSSISIAGFTAWTLFVVLFFLNPWIYWVPSFDVHMETFGVFFVACAYALFRKGNSWGYVFAFLTALCGTASVFYVVGLGVLLLARALVRTYRMHSAPIDGAPSQSDRLVQRFAPGAILAVLGIIWLYALSALHATQGSPTGGFVYLLGATGAKVVHVTFAKVLRGLVSHPIDAFRTTFLSHGWNLWANTSSAGLFGLFTPVGFFLALPTLFLDNLLKGQQSSYPTFQNLPEFIFIALGTVVLLASMIKRRRTFRLGLALAVLVVLNEIGWFVVWFPKTRTHWVKTSAAAANVLWRADRKIPFRDEVVITNGVAGLFGGHVHLYEFYGPTPIPVRAPVVWFVMSPDQGIEVVPTAVMERAISELAELPGSKLVEAAHDVYVFRWQVPKGIRSISLSTGDELAAWTTPGVAGRASLSGPPARWRLESNGREGYVLDGDYWREFPGSYRATIHMSATGPANIEVWDDTSGRLMGRVHVNRLPPGSTVSISFRLHHEHPGYVYQGAGAFLDLPIPQIPGDEIEVRVWSGGHVHIRISSVVLGSR